MLYTLSSQVNKWHFVFVLKQVVPILVSANISAIQVSPLPVLNYQSKFRKFTRQCTYYNHNKFRYNTYGVDKKGRHIYYGIFKSYGLK